MTTGIPVPPGVIKLIGSFLDSPQTLCCISQKQENIWSLMRQGCYEQMTRHSQALQPYVRHVRETRKDDLTASTLFRLVHIRMQNECRRLSLHSCNSGFIARKENIDAVNLWGFFHNCMRSGALVSYNYFQAAQLLSVTRLDIKESDLSLTQLPSIISEFTQLRALRVTGHRLWTLPPEIKGLKELRVLHIVRCRLAFLPDEIGDLPQLKVLVLRENNLRSLPVAICRLKQLEKLDVSKNPLQVVPGEITLMPSLKKFIQ